jgi:hypothetical protein
MEPYEAKIQTANGTEEAVEAPSEPQLDSGEPPPESLSSPSAPASIDTCICGRPGGRCICAKSGASETRDMAPPSYVYSIGRIEARFPNLSVEREFAQVRALEKRLTAGKTEQETLYAVLSKYRYLSRQMCYVFAVQGVETYILVPEDPADFGLLLVEAIKPPADAAEIQFDVVIGVRGPIAQPDRCGGLMIPVVTFDQIYSFTKSSLLESIPVPNTFSEATRRMDPAAFRRSSEEVFDRIIQMADNAGATDEHRALNYAAVRHPGVYARVAQEHAENRSLTAVEVRRSALGSVRSVMDVIFAFTDRATDVVEKYFCRVDVSGEFPFLVTKLSPFYER